LRRVVQVEARDVAGVDRFHHQFDARRLQLVGRVRRLATKVFPRWRRALWADAGQAVDLGVAQHLGVFDGLVDAGAELFDAVRVAGDAALTLGPVTGRQVEQHLGQAVGVELP
jgi:hypothetical protein